MDKNASGFTLRSHPDVRVSSRAHKMSKSRGNVVNPDDIVASHGADSLRLFEMFLGPLQDTKVQGRPSSRFFRQPGMRMFCTQAASHCRTP